MTDFDLITLLQRVCSRYPGPARLSALRLTQTLYLIDWRSSLARGRQVTDLTWQHHDLGPWTDEVMQAISSRPELFRVRVSKSLFGESRSTVELAAPPSRQKFEPEIEEIIEFVLDSTCHLEMRKFLDLVFLTYPIATQQSFATESSLDLVALARRRTAILGRRPRRRSPRSSHRPSKNSLELTSH